MLKKSLTFFVISLFIILGKSEYWFDEFESTDLFNQNWRHELGNHGWGNNEWQDYTSNNTYLKDGLLEILSEKTSSGYKSARIITKKAFKYGIFEIRAKLPWGRGTWPAIWFLAANRPLNWPYDGEIDLMEHVGYDQNVIHGTIHCGSYNHMINTQKFGIKRVETASSDFHVYKLEWTKSSIIMYIDGEKLFQFDKEANAGYNEWPFDNYFNIILNTAIGGNWGGAMGVDDSVFPQKFFIDYVRFYPYEYSLIADSSSIENENNNNNTNNNNIVWLGDWAFSCDFKDRDLTSVQVPGELCSSVCQSNPVCTHFSWNKYLGGTCWLKYGEVKKADAFKINDPVAVCGVVRR